MKFGRVSQERLKDVADRLGVVVVVCMCCHRFIQLLRSRGAEGGFSHGICPKGCEEAREWGFDVRLLE